MIPQENPFDLNFRMIFNISAARRERTKIENNNNGELFMLKLLHMFPTIHFEYNFIYFILFAKFNQLEKCGTACTYVCSSCQKIIVFL